MLLSCSRPAACSAWGHTSAPQAASKSSSSSFSSWPLRAAPAHSAPCHAAPAPPSTGRGHNKARSRPSTALPALPDQHQPPLHSHLGAQASPHLNCHSLRPQTQQGTMQAAGKGRHVVLSSSSSSSRRAGRQGLQLVQSVAAQAGEAAGEGGSEGGEAPRSLSQQLAELTHEVTIPAGRLVCRMLDAADVTAACVVLTRAFAGTPEAIGLTDATKFVAKVGDSLPKGVLYIAELFPEDRSLLPPNRDSRVIATVSLSLHEDTLQQIPTLPPPPHTAYLSNMAVDIKFRRQGVAKALLHVCDKASALAGLQEIYLHVRQADEAAAQLYAAHGYEEVARDRALGAQLKGVRPRVLMRKAVPGL